MRKGSLKRSCRITIFKFASFHDRSFHLLQLSSKNLHAINNSSIKYSQKKKEIQFESRINPVEKEARKTNKSLYQKVHRRSILPSIRFPKRARRGDARKLIAFTKQGRKRKKGTFDRPLLFPPLIPLDRHRSNEKIPVS